MTCNRRRDTTGESRSRSGWDTEALYALVSKHDRLSVLRSYTCRKLIADMASAGQEVPSVSLAHSGRVLAKIRLAAFRVASKLAYRVEPSNPRADTFIMWLITDPFDFRPSDNVLGGSIATISAGAMTQ